MKLLIFHSALAPYRIDFFNFLHEKLNTHIFFLSKTNRNQHFENETLFKDVNFNYSFSDSKIVIKGRDINFDIPKFIIKEKPNIIITGEYGLPSLLSIFIKKLFRSQFKIFTICDDSLHISQNCKGIRKLLRSWVSANVDGIILLSDQVGDWYLKNVNLKKPPIIFPLLRNEVIFRKKIHNVINISNNYIERYKISGKRIFIYVGRLDNKVKNIKYILKSFDNASTENDVLILIGSGIDRDELFRFSTKLTNKHRIVFAGKFQGDELLAWYNISSHLILASEYEPFGAVVNEALLSGTSVLCSLFAGASTLVNKNNGLIFNPKKNKALEIAILNISKDEQKICPKSIKSIRHNLMDINFNYFTDNLINRLNE